MPLHPRDTLPGFSLGSLIPKRKGLQPPGYAILNPYMPTLSESAIATLLTPYLDPPPTILPQLSLYLDLLLKWNARTNLTAIRDPEEIVRRHFGESLFAARHLPPEPKPSSTSAPEPASPASPSPSSTPKSRSPSPNPRTKKSTFLREAVRTLALSNVKSGPTASNPCPPTANSTSYPPRRRRHGRRPPRRKPIHPEASSPPHHRNPGPADGTVTSTPKLPNGILYTDNADL